MMKRKLIFIFFIFLIKTFCFSQENINSNTEDKSTTEITNPFSQPFFSVTDFFFGLTPSVYLNTHSQTTSAPSPIFFPIYAGFNWPNNYFFSFQPSIKIWYGYFYINQGEVLPAEIENRTAVSLSFLLNVPIIFKADFWEKSDIKISAGLAFLIRFALLAPNINEFDSGYYGSAKDDVSKINSWFYENARFLYLSLGADWMFKITDVIQLGPEIGIYIPIGSIFSSWTVDGLIISAGVKLVY